MNAPTILSALVALASVAFASGCIDGADDCEGDEPCEESCADGSCEEEELATGESAISVTFDAQMGCENRGWIWNAESQTCASPKSVCQADGDYWSTARKTCFDWGSPAHEKDVCATMNYLVSHAGPPNMTVDGLAVRCVPGMMPPGGIPGVTAPVPCEGSLTYCARH